MFKLKIEYINGEIYMKIVEHVKIIDGCLMFIDSRYNKELFDLIGVKK